MANFFQPGPSTAQTSSTPSAATQAEDKYKIELLGQLLNAMGGTAPSFASFVKGGPAQRGFPGGMGGGTADVLAAMGQPGAFTSHATQQMQGATPSAFSDITQMGVLGALISQALGLNPLAALGGILSPLGGPLGLSPQQGTTLDATTPPSSAAGLDSLVGGGNTPPGADLLSILGAGDPSLLPAGYGVLDPSSGLSY